MSCKLRVWLLAAQGIRIAETAGSPAFPAAATIEEKQTKWVRCFRPREAASRFQAPAALGFTHLFQLSPVWHSTAYSQLTAASCKIMSILGAGHF